MRKVCLFLMRARYVDVANHANILFYSREFAKEGEAIKGGEEGSQEGEKREKEGKGCREG